MSIVREYLGQRNNEREPSLLNRKGRALELGCEVRLVTEARGAVAGGKICNVSAPSGGALT